MAQQRLYSNIQIRQEREYSLLSAAVHLRICEVLRVVLTSNRLWPSSVEFLFFQIQHFVAKLVHTETIKTAYTLGRKYIIFYFCHLIFHNRQKKIQNLIDAECT